MTWHGNNRGIALLMTLAFITLAMSLAVEANRQSRVAIASTDAVQNRLLAGQMAAAGVHGAMAILIQDRTDSETDHLKETWADPDRLAEANLSLVRLRAGLQPIYRTIMMSGVVLLLCYSAYIGYLVWKG